MDARSRGLFKKQQKRKAGSCYAGYISEVLLENLVERQPLTENQVLLFLVLESKYQIENCDVFILSHQLPPLQSTFYFQGRQLLCSGGEDQ